MNIRKLKALRVEAGKTQADMAALLGCTISAYSLKENGKRPFAQSEIAKIAQSLEIGAEVIFAIFFSN